MDGAEVGSGRHERHDLVERREVGRDEGPGHLEAERGGQRVGDAGVGRVGVGVRGEQRRARAHEAVHERALRCVGADAVHAPQQQRMVGDEQLGAARDGLVDRLRDHIDGHEHRPQLLRGVAAHQPDRVPFGGELGRVSRVQRGKRIPDVHAASPPVRG